MSGREHVRYGLRGICWWRFLGFRAVRSCGYDLDVAALDLSYLGCSYGGLNLPDLFCSVAELCGLLLCRGKRKTLWMREELLLRPRERPIRIANNKIL